jgi:ParB/RepB/Spo0J family partition protein
MKSELRNTDSIQIPEYVIRAGSKVDDDQLRQSIEKSGIKQPLVLVGDRLADGLKRLRIAQLLGIARVPVVYDDVPAGRDPDAYIRELRFLLDEKRQDLLPSQKADLIIKLKAMFSMNHTQVAAYLGINQDSVTNWLAVKQYIDPVAQAVDQGLVTMHAARTFDGLTEAGQRFIWRHHRQELMTEAGGRIHKALRKQYSPASHPEFYRNADLIKQRLERKGGKRKGRSRPTITREEKRRLLTSFEMRELELKESEAELHQLKAEIQASITPIAAIMRHDKLWSEVPAEMREELERFAEVYVA